LRHPDKVKIFSSIFFWGQMKTGEKLAGTVAGTDSIRIKKGFSEKR
jgi:hypothetical protein